MKVIGVLNNYESKGNAELAFPNIFLLADSSLLKDGKPFFLPAFDAEFKMYASLIVRVNRLGKNIAERFAHRYYDAVAIGLNVRAEDNLSQQRERELPWSSSVAFDGSAIMGDFVDKEILDIEKLKFIISKNEKVIFEWDYTKLIKNIDTIISEISARFTLKIGDYIYIGMPDEGFPIEINDQILGSIDDKVLLKFKIK